MQSTRQCATAIATPSVQTTKNICSTASSQLNPYTFHIHIHIHLHPHTIIFYTTAKTQLYYLYTKTSIQNQIIIVNCNILHNHHPVLRRVAADRIQAGVLALSRALTLNPSASCSQALLSRRQSLRRGLHPPTLLHDLSSSLFRLEQVA